MNAELSALGAQGQDREQLARVVTTVKALDTLVWQMFASVILPGTTIHAIVAVATWLVSGAVDGADPASLPEPLAALLQDPESRTLVVKTLPTVTGLGCIPLIVHPLDTFVHWAMDETFRPASNRYICEHGGNAAHLHNCELVPRPRQRRKIL